ncbi:MAG: hypothetical protein P4L71_13300 [Acetobacteraceae bacterium]|nr:hypothetical protein [Acetobacteraceae bacterium]
MMGFSSPYPGLRPFDAEEADLFFGREAQVDELLRRLHSTRFLAVVGPSGCGKSSLVRAGMIAALESGFLVSAGSRWQFAVMRPGGRPMNELATALVVQTGLAADAPDTNTAIGMLGATLRRGPLGLLEALQETPLAPGSNLLVLVDQFEEIFRFRREGGVDEADAFVALLLQSARQRDVPVYIVLTMRSDFFGDCAAFAGLPEALNQSQYLTPRLSREQRRVAIVGPARVFGGDVAADLVNRLLNEMGNDPDQLPLMQHLLMRMWTWRTPPSDALDNPDIEDDGEGIADGPPRHLTLEDYDAVGGLRRALSNHANEAFDRLDEQQQSIARTLFRRLSERAPGSRDIRRPTAVEEIAALAGVTRPELTKVVNVFRAPGCSFVVPSWPMPLDDHTILDITHEALIRQWDKLRAWADEEAQSADNYRFLERNAALWKQGRMALWGTPNLEMALDWRIRERPTDLWARRYGGNFEAAMEFLEASAEARDVQEAVQLAQRQKQVRHLRRVTALSVFTALLFAGALGAVYWLHFAEHVSYYSSYVNRWGEWVGVGELTPDQVRHRAQSLKYVQRDFHPDPHSWWGYAYTTNEIEAVDADGKCTPNNEVKPELSETDQEFSPTHECRWVFVRDATTGQLVYENAYDQNGNQRWGYEYLPGTDRSQRAAYYVGPNGTLANFKNSPASVIRFDFSDEGNERQLRYFDRDGHPQSGPNHAYGRRFEYNGAGLPTTMVSIDQFGKDMDDTDGNAAMHLTYDRAGNGTRQEAFDAAGRPALMKEGWHEERTEFDQYGNVTSYAFFDKNGSPALDNDGVHLARDTRDDKGNLLRVEYYGKDGKPTASTAGYQRIEIRSSGPYNTRADWAFFDAEGHKTTNSSGVHEYRRTYDARGFKLSAKAFGLDLQPIAAIDGCYESRYTYDTDGHEVSVSCFDKDGKPALDESGEHSTVSKFDDRGNRTESAYFDREGNPTTVNEGYHMAKATYDSLGDVESVAFFGVDGAPVRSTDHYHRRVMKHNGRGSETELSYFDEDGHAMLGPLDFAKRVRKYDDHDNAFETTYYDAEGQLTDTSKEAEGYAIMRKTFDDQWRTTRISYFGIDESPVALSDGVADQRFRYDGDVTEVLYSDAAGLPASIDGCSGHREIIGTQMRKVVEWTCIDPAGHRVADVNGVAIVRTKYDDHGNILETSNFGTDDHPAAGPGGIASARFQYDNAGRETERSYYDANNVPTPGGEGAAFVRTRYDTVGHEIEVAYADQAGKLLVRADGYAIRRSTYDDHGKLTELSYFGADGQPAIMKEGYHRIAVRYNERGRIVERAFHGADDNLIALPGGFAIRKTQYDDHGEVIEEAYFGPDGRPVVASDGYQRTIRHYDGRGHLTQQAFYGLDGKLLVEPNAGYAVLRAQYDNQGRKIEEAFFGADGEPIAQEGGYHRMETHYADHASSNETVFYGPDGGLFQASSRGYARSRTEQALYGPDGHLLAHCLADSTASAESLSGCMDADGHPVERRIVITRIIPGSQAEKIGVLPGDVVETYAGQNILAERELRRLITHLTQGERRLVVWRGTQHTEFAVSPGLLGIYMEMRFVREAALDPANAVR